MAGTDSVKYLLIGGGVTSAAAAQNIREVDASGAVLIVCGENRMPYDRPPLSKGFLGFKPADPEDVESKDASFYTEKNVQVRIGTWAQRIDRASRLVHLSDGSEVQYEQLLLCTGSTPTLPSLPGIDAPNVFQLRTVEDAQMIRTTAADVENVVVIGAGYMGMEVAASLRDQGKEVTVVDRHEHPWGKFASPITGNALRAYFENKGVRFSLEDEPEEFVGEGRISTVRTKRGSFAADMVVVATGVRQNVELAQEAGLEMDEKHGVAVDATLRTSDPNIWAAGDIAAFEDVVVGKRWHAEHYMNAKWQGQRVGRNMAGDLQQYEKVPYFFSDLFDLMMVLRGDSRGGRPIRVLGDLDTYEFVELYADEAGRVVMALGITRDGDRYDPMTDALETIVAAKKAAADVTAEEVGLKIG
jgi:3-phenylpropionate/trans-cinnamate dioxygenase ferredoxin reductase component